MGGGKGHKKDTFTGTNGRYKIKLAKGREKKTFLIVDGVGGGGGCNG